MTSGESAYFGLAITLLGIEGREDLEHFPITLLGCPVPAAISSFFGGSQMSAKQ